MESINNLKKFSIYNHQNTSHTFHELAKRPSNNTYSYSNKYVGREGYQQQCKASMPIHLIRLWSKNSGLHMWSETSHSDHCLSPANKQKKLIILLYKIENIMQSCVQLPFLCNGRVEHNPVDEIEEHLLGPHLSYCVIVPSACGLIKWTPSQIKACFNFKM